EEDEEEEEEEEEEGEEEEEEEEEEERKGVAKADGEEKEEKKEEGQKGYERAEREEQHLCKPCKTAMNMKKCRGREKAERACLFEGGKTSATTEICGFCSCPSGHKGCPATRDKAPRAPTSVPPEPGEQGKSKKPVIRRRLKQFGANMVTHTVSDYTKERLLAALARPKAVVSAAVARKGLRNSSNSRRRQRSVRGQTEVPLAKPNVSCINPRDLEAKTTSNSDSVAKFPAELAPAKMPGFKTP
ncbi:unnamed protein product, partial [Protopolystoma xenopodis]